MFDLFRSKNFIFRTFGMAVSLLNSIVLSVFYGQEALGYFTLLTLILGLSSQLFSLSLNSFSVRLYAKVSLDKVGGLILNNFILQFFFFVVGVILFRSLYPEIIRQNYLLFVFLLYLTMGNAVLDNVFTGIGKPNLGALLLISRNFSVLFFSFIYFLIDNYSENLNYFIIISMIAVEIVSFLLFLLYTQRMGILNLNEFEINIDFIKGAMKSGTTLTIYSFLYLLNISLPRLILSFDEQSLVDLGKFQINYLIAMILSNLLESNYSTNLLPSIIKENDLGRKIDLFKILFEIKPYLMLMLSYTILVLLALPVIKRYINGIDSFSFLILSINSIFFFFYRMIHYRIYAGSYDKYLIVINGLITIFSSTTLYWFHKSFSYNGVLISTFLSTIFMILLSVCFLKFRINDSRI
jgi:O-antigen/teichoic acid export membrane protein